jgi:hypothetical protein
MLGPFGKFSLYTDYQDEQRSIKKTAAGTRA